MIFERPCASSYLLTIAISALSVTILKIFTVEMCMTLTITLRMGKERSNVNMSIEIPYKAVVGISSLNVCSMCHHFRDIRSRNNHGIGLDL